MKNISSILQLKIGLVGSRPLIWRRILIPTDVSFFNLHVAIQDSFCWEDAHLHQFHTINPYTRMRNSHDTLIKYPMPEFDDLDDTTQDLDERKIKLIDFLKTAKDRVWYEYDFGDSWMHEIIVEKIVPQDQEVQYPYLKDGACACPPEDCGGIGGYAHLLSVLANPRNPEHHDMLEWLGINEPAQFNPDAFDKKDIAFRDPQRVLKMYERAIQ